ncbi:alpha/beta fold hydrolase [Microbacterium telephonicum]|uniref:Alpha-beta hydrolase superfamily lysophospholipase n=1 Tax=Microbacterium telephonicum TaxID=1714841 RepID=A0A498CLB8_9MICO|nr:alpha/beta fold hydrolase [Microbacterium telephonicum]RLK52791.1 alpha-beta hydrolase superfamily lysophospholipase [Microbacterium telephonicum]
MPDAPTSTFTHDGATIIVEEHGDPASSTVFLLVHGIGMGRKVFADLTTLLAPHGRVIAVDLPGYGEAPEPPRTPTMERLADLLAAYLRSTGRAPVVAVGHSMGSQVVTELAARHLRSVARVVLVAPTVDRRRRCAVPQLARLGADLLGESPRVLWLGAREYLRAGPNLRRKLHAMLAHRPERAYPRVQAPTLVLRGGGDLVCPQRWCDEVVALLPDAEIAVIAGHGHETLIRNAEPAARRMLAFLAAR